MSIVHKPEVTGNPADRRFGARFSTFFYRLTALAPDGSAALRDYRILSSLVGLAAVVALAAIPAMPVWAAPLGLVVGGLYYLIFARRERRRLHLLRQPFPDAWRDTLQRRVPLYLPLTET